MAEVSEALPGAKTLLGVDTSAPSPASDPGLQASAKSTERITPSARLTTSTPVASSGGLPSTSTSVLLISSGPQSQTPILSTPSVSSIRTNNVDIVSPLGMDSAVTSSLPAHDSHVSTSLGSSIAYNTSVITTVSSEIVRRNSVATTQSFSTAQLEKSLAYTPDNAVVLGNGAVSSGGSPPVLSVNSAAASVSGAVSSSSSALSSAVSSNSSVLSSGGSAVSSVAGATPSGKGKKSGGKKGGSVAAANSSCSPSSAGTAEISVAVAAAAAAAAAAANSSAVESDLSGNTPHKVLQAVRSTSLPFPLPVPTYSQTVQAARASGNVLAERATIIRETVKFFLSLKYWWTTEDYDRIAELVVNQFPELRDPATWPSAPATTPCFGKVRLDLSMCARNIRRITKNQEKRRGSPAQTGKEGSASVQGESTPAPPPPPPPPPPTPKTTKGGGGKSRRKSSATPSISVPTMVTLASAAQMLPHTAHTSAMHSDPSSQASKELGNLPYLLTSTSPISTTTTTTTTNSCTVLPPVAHFLGHPSAHSHTTGGIVFPSLLPATHATTTSQPSPPAPLSSPPPMPKVSHTPTEGGVRTTVEAVSGQEAYTGTTFSLSGAWRADAQLPDPLPVPPYSEKVMKAKKMGVTKYERPLIIRETVLFFLSLKYWWSSVDYDRISHFLVDYFPDLKDPMLSPNMPPNRRVRTDLSQTARNIRRREVMLKRRDNRSPEARFTAVGTVSLPPHTTQQVSSDFCNELLAAASIIESRTAALHQSDIAKALENHAQASQRDSEALTSVIAYTNASSKEAEPGASAESEKAMSNSKSKDTSESGKYQYGYIGGGEVGSVEGGGVVNSQLAVIKQEVGEGVGGGVVEQYQQQVLEAQVSQQAWLSQAMSQAISMQALSSLSLPTHILSDHLLTSHTTPTTLTPSAPPAHQSAGGAAAAAAAASVGSSTAQSPSQPSGLSTPAYSTPTSLTDTPLSDASVDRMSAMAMWRSTCLPDPLPVPPYSLNVLRARDSGNTASARPRIIRETTQYFLALKMWWTTQDYERIAELVLREFPQLISVQNIKKDLGTCARNMRRRLPMSKNKQWATYQSPTQAGLKEEESVGEGGGVTLGELATMASLREAQDKSRGEVGVVVSVAEDPRHSLLAQSVYEQNAWNLFYQQQFSTPDPAPALPPTRVAKRSLSDTAGTKGYELGEKELTEALKQSVVQSSKQLGDAETAARRHSVDVSDAAKLRDMKQESTGKAVAKVTSSEVNKSDSYPVMKELMSHPALSVRDPKLSMESPAFHATWTAHAGGVGEGAAAAYQHPTPARAHSQPACPLRSEVSISESEEAPMNLTCAPASEGSKRGKSPKAVKLESKGSKKGGGADAFSAREQVWFPHGSPWKKSGQNMFKALPTPLPVPKYSHKLVKAREEGLAYRHRSEIIRETARFFLAFKYWWSSADYSRISELVVAQFPDLKDAVTPPGQPCYRRVQRDLSMCARNLRRKNTRQQQLSSGETVTAAASPKKAKGGNKEKKSKKAAGIKVEASAEQPALQTVGELPGLGTGEGGVVGSGVSAMLTTSLPLPTTTTASSSSTGSTSLVQAMLQASVDQALLSIPPVTSLSATTSQHLSSTSPWTVPQHSTNATILSHLISPIGTATTTTTTTTTTPHSSVHTAHTTVAYSAAYTPAAHPPAYTTAHSTAHSVSVVVTAPGGMLSKEGASVVDRTLWPVMVPANGRSSDTPMTGKASAKKKSSASKSDPAASKLGQITPKSGHVTAKSTANIQPKVVKPAVNSTPAGSARQGQGDDGGQSVSQGVVGGRVKPRTEGGGVNAADAGNTKRSKEAVRHLTSRTVEGRSLSNTTAIVTPTLSEAHTSAGASSAESGSVADKVYINPEHGSELQRQLSQLWQEGKFFDASLEVDNYRLPAHKLVLLAASPYLQSTFRHANPTSHLEVNLPRDTGVEAARDFLKYVYQGVLHVTPGTVQALRRIAAMLQIEQLLAYCDDFLLQLSATSAGVASGVAVPHRASVAHSASQMRRVSVSLREPAPAHPLTAEQHTAPALTSPTLPGNASQVPAATGSNTERYGSSQPSSSRKRKAGSLSTSLDTSHSYLMESRMEGESREDVGALSTQGDMDRQKVLAGENRQQTVEVVQTQHSSDLPMVKHFRTSEESVCSDAAASKLYLDSQAAVTYQTLSNSWPPSQGEEPNSADRRQHSVLAQHLSGEKSHHGRAPTSSVIHRGPNLVAAASAVQLSQSELPSISTTITTTATTTTPIATATTGSNGNNSSNITFTSSNGSSNLEEGEGVVHYFTDSSEPSQVGVTDEEGVLVQLLPEGPVHMEIGEGMQLQHHPQTMHISAQHAIQLAGGEHAIHLSGDQAIHFTGDGTAIQLTREEALQLAGHATMTLEQFSEQQLSEQVSEEQLRAQHQLSQEQQLSEEVAVQLAEQSIALCGGETQSMEEEQQGVEKVEDAGEGDDGQRTVEMRALCGQDSWRLGEGTEVVVEGGEGGEMMVEEVIVQSGGLLQEVDIAACETVECSLLPQTYCSSPESSAQGHEHLGVVEECEGLPGEAVEERVEEGGEQEAALQTLASQWARQQYAQAPLDADSARQFVAALQERRMYKQPATSATLQPPPSYQETLYVQPCGDGETVYVGQAMEGEELVVETSVVSDTPPPQTAVIRGDDEGDAQGSLLPQTYCSSPPPSQSPSVNS